MRRIYLIRHGRPDFPDGANICLGQTDLGLGVFGRLQAALCAEYVSDREVTAVFCSRLSRSRETAMLLDAPLSVADGLEELYAGEWDGLSFDAIRERWPDLYKRRGEDLSLQPPGAEDPERGLRRFRLALDTALEVSTGDIAVVGHKSAIQLLLCQLQGLPLTQARGVDVPYGSVAVLSLRDGLLYVDRQPLSPLPCLDETVCMRLLSAADAPVDVIGHSCAVSREAMRLVCALASAGTYPDERVIFAAAMLHDMCRRSQRHPEAAAELIARLGYERVADVIRQHHDLDEPRELNEAAVVFIADKLVRGTERVSVRERFEGSFYKCKSPEAAAAHQRRYDQAMVVADSINKVCGKDLIQ